MRREGGKEGEDEKEGEEWISEGGKGGADLTLTTPIFRN